MSTSMKLRIPSYPLLCWHQHGYVDVVKILLTQNDIDVNNKFAQSHLNAIKQGHLDIVKMFLECESTLVIFQELYCGNPI